MASVSYLKLWCYHFSLCLATVFLHFILNKQYSSLSKRIYFLFLGLQSMLKVFGEVKWRFRHLLSCHDWSLQSLLSTQAMLQSPQYWWCRELRSAHSYHCISTCLCSSTSQSISVSQIKFAKVMGHTAYSFNVCIFFFLVVSCRKVAAERCDFILWLRQDWTNVLPRLIVHCCSECSGQHVHHSLYFHFSQCFHLISCWHRCETLLSICACGWCEPQGRFVSCSLDLVDTVHLTQ